MKFRHFEFRLFPKLKYKKKKKQKKCNPDYPRDIGLDKNFNYSNPGYYSYYDNLAADDSIISTNRKLCNDLVCSATDGCYECRCSCYATYPLPELTINVSEDACDCICGTRCSSHVSCLSSCERSSRETPETPSTIPRTRTRIKTNPWLPSPKSTPAPSPTEPANSIGFALTELTIPYSYPLTFGDDDDDNIPEFGSLRAEHDLDHLTLGENSDTFHSVIKLKELDGVEGTLGDQDYGLTTVTALGERDDGLKRCVSGTYSEKDQSCVESTEGDTLKTALTLSNFTYAQFLTYDSSATSTPVTDSHRSIVNIPEFEYESKTNELLESASIPRDDSFETNFSYGMAKEAKNDKFLCELTCVKTFTSKDNSSEFLVEVSSRSDDGLHGNEAGDDMLAEEGALSSNADWTFCDSHMQTSSDTGYGSISRDTDSINSSNEILECTEITSEDGLEWDNEPSAQNLLYNFYQQKQQQLMTRSLLTETDIMYNNKRSRSLADIEMSLDEKVSRLRAEKLFVQSKIREAIEEEIIRRRQLRMFRTGSPDNRKELLVKTLHDLKARLENQSARLQTSYDTVLSLQRRFSERRNGPNVIETSI